MRTEGNDLVFSSHVNDRLSPILAEMVFRDRMPVLEGVDPTWEADIYYWVENTHIMNTALVFFIMHNGSRIAGHLIDVGAVHSWVLATIYQAQSQGLTVAPGVRLCAPSPCSQEEKLDHHDKHW